MKKGTTICVLIGIGLIGLAGFKLAKDRSANSLKAGAAKIEITPRVKGFRQGSGLRDRDWSSSKIITPLYVRALVMTNGETKIAIISCDMVAVDKGVNDSIRNLVEKEVGIPASHVVICASHSHSTPHALAKDNFLQELRSPSQAEIEYVDSLPRKFVQAVTEAKNNLTPVRVGVHKGFEDTIGRNSRRRMKDGNITWVAKGGPPSGLYDPEVGVIHINAVDGSTIATLLNYSCHPMGKQIGGSYAEMTSKAIELELGGVALFTLGACGNVHPAYNGAEGRAERLTYEVLRVVRNIKMSESAKIKCITKEIVLLGRDFEAIDPKLIATIASQAGERSRKVESAWLAELELMKKSNRAPVNTSVEVISIGDALLVGIPGELFVELGLDIKWKSNRDKIFVATCSNDYIGYIPTQIAYQEGGYQTLQRARVAPGAGEQLVMEALDLCSTIMTE